ncbi:MAG: VPLPA-CTERM sorting domain-containing protein [Deltaproteobacteria bacterium]|nr:VPLPA-CTERM sorting domain-containing protein [Deltaproteobacteria bacterium]
MKKRFLFSVFLVFTLLTYSSSFAGPYSPGKGGADEVGFIDAGIAGFLGPAGEGVAATDTNGNYVNPIFVGWATEVVSYVPSDNTGAYGQNGIGTQFANPALALGPVTGNNMNIVTLGDMNMAEINSWTNNLGINPPGGITGPGILTLGFDNAIYNGEGADFAAFENGFVSNYSTGAGSVAGQMFAELGFVDVSTNGTDFARFPSDYLNYPNATTNGMVDNRIDLNGTGTMVSTNYLTQDVSNIYNLVGKHANAYSASWGTPFDLDDLLNDPLVLSGAVDLNEINYVRIVDIPGNGTLTDADGNPIYDAWVTWGSGGLDFEALGVINAVPIPGAIWLLGSGIIGLLGIRRRKSGRSGY